MWVDPLSIFSPVPEKNSPESSQTGPLEALEESRTVDGDLEDEPSLSLEDDGGHRIPKDLGELIR